MERRRHLVSVVLALLLVTLMLRTGNVATNSVDDKPVLTLGILQYASSTSMPRILWNKTYGGAYRDYAYSLLQAVDNGFVLAGGTYSYGSGASDFWLVKTDSLGNVQWARTYGGSGNDEAHSVIQTFDRGHAILGTTSSFGAGSSDFWLVKTDERGNLLWSKTYGGANYDDGWSIVETFSGDLVLAGWTASFGSGSGDFWLVKTDRYGNLLWSKTYGGVFFDAASSVKEAFGGGYVLTGYTYSFGTGGPDFWLIKTDINGNKQWDRTYGGAGDDFGFSVIQTFEGGYAIVGSTSSFGMGVYDFWLVRTNGFGIALWNKTYGGIDYDEAWAVLQTVNNGFVLAGWTASFGTGGSDCWLIAIDSLGKAQWNVTWGGSGNDNAYSLVSARYDANLLLAGETESFGAGNSDFLLVKILSVPDNSSSSTGGGGRVPLAQ